MNYDKDTIEFLPKPTHYRFRDLTNVQFGCLTVLGLIRRQTAPYSRYFWLCQCSCGQQSEVPSGNLINGITKSCGCQQYAIPANIKHGKSRTPEYGVFKRMRQRCLDQNTAEYPNYGGRGITICNRWLEGENGQHPFECFIADMGKRPDSKHSIERIDNAGNYCPENCKWATDVEQANNQRKNVRYTFNGQSQTLSQWSRDVGIKATTLGRRIALGWTIGDALTIAVGSVHKLYVHTRPRITSK